MAYRTIQSNFTGGLLSPLSTGLVGTDLYNKGLEMAENCFYGPSGGVYKRNGTKLLARYGIEDADKANVKVVSMTLDYVDTKGKYRKGDYVFIFGTDFVKAYKVPATGDDDVMATSCSVFKTGMSEWSCADPSTLSVLPQSGAVNNGFLMHFFVTHNNGYPQVFTISTGGEQFYWSSTAYVSPITPETETEGAVKTTVACELARTYPTVQTLYDGRWFIAAPPKYGLTLYASRPIDANGHSRYDDFTNTYSVYSATNGWQAVDLADLAITYTFDNSDGATEIQWMYPFNGGLFVGTDAGVYLCSQTGITSSTDNPIKFTKQSSYGAAKNLVTSIGNYLLYVSTDRKRVIALAYSQQYNSLSGGNISEAIEHHFTRDSQITAIAATDGPVPHLYISVSGQGVFVCQFDPLNSIIAWSKITQYCYLPLGLCSISGVSRKSSALAIFNYHLLEPTSSVSYGDCILELLEEVSAGSVWQYPSLDKYIRLTPGTAYNISITESGAQHSEKTTCLIKRNLNYENTLEGYQPNNVPMAYDITYPAYAIGTTVTQPVETDATKQQDWYVGESYSFAILIPRSELPANGTSQGTERAVKKVTLRLFNSYGGVVFLFPGFESGMIKSPNLGDVENNLTFDYGPTYRKPNNYAKQALYKVFDKDVFNGWQGLFTGDKAINFITPTVEDDRIAIVQSDPMPFAICAVIVDRAVKES